MSARAPHAAATISRREIALAPYVWWALRGTFAVFALSTFVFSFILPGVSPEAMRVLAAGLGAVAAVLLRCAPPEPGSLAVHFALALTYLGPACALYAFAPEGSAAVGTAMFIGPLTAIWLVDRRQMAAHGIAATIALFTPSALGVVDVGTLVACIALAPALWALGICCLLVMEAAEGEGKDLDRLVRRDPLTGVGNRRLLDERPPLELGRHVASRQHLTLLALDLNGFKALNDTAGHAAGDEVLRLVARGLEEAVGARGTIVRQGGDEFLVLLPHADAAEARATVVAIRRRLVSLDALGTGITTGIGVASFPADGRDPAELLELADQRLALDKERQRVGTPSVSAPQPRSARAPERTLLQLPPSVAPPEQRASGGGMADAGVSRRALNHNRAIWRLLSGMFLVFGAIGAGVCLWTPELAGPEFPFVVAFGSAVGLAFAVSKPTELGSRNNHIVIAMAYIVPVLCMATTGGSAAIGSAIFIGPLAAVRLVDRREIAAHYVAATILFAGLVPAGLASPATTVAILILVLATWVLGACCVFFLEAAEAQSAELKELVLRDPLTGLGNRRRLHETLDEELRHHASARRSLAVVALDLNGFKALNDEVGHAAGDQLLTEVAGALQAAAGPGDVVTRQGGDEFCILLPDITADDLVARATTIRTSLAAIRCNGRPLTTGLGIASFPADGKSPDDLLAIADARLIANKAAERARLAEVPAAPPAPAQAAEPLGQLRRA